MELHGHVFRIVNVQALYLCIMDTVLSILVLKIIMKNK